MSNRLLAYMFIVHNVVPVMWSVCSIHPLRLIRRVDVTPLLRAGWNCSMHPGCCIKDPRLERLPLTMGSVQSLLKGAMQSAVVPSIRTGGWLLNLRVVEPHDLEKDGDAGKEGESESGTALAAVSPVPIFSIYIATFKRDCTCPEFAVRLCPVHVWRSSLTAACLSCTGDSVWIWCLAWTAAWWTPSPSPWWTCTGWWVGWHHQTHPQTHTRTRTNPRISRYFAVKHTYTILLRNQFVSQNNLIRVLIYLPAVSLSSYRFYLSFT